MKLIRTNRELFPRFFDDFWGRDLFDKNEFSTTVPAVNINEGAEEFNIELAVPGIDKKDINIEVDNGLMTVSYENKSENEQNKKEYYKKEFNYHSFSRTFSLPDSVNTDQIKATYKDGILHMSIPKKDEAKQKPVRTISIS